VSERIDIDPGAYRTGHRSILPAASQRLHTRPTLGSAKKVACYNAAAQTHAGQKTSAAGRAE
jgi:hypothetical protein